LKNFPELILKKRLIIINVLIINKLTAPVNNGLECADSFFFFAYARYDFIRNITQKKEVIKDRTSIINIHEMGILFILVELRIMHEIKNSILRKENNEFFVRSQKHLMKKIIIHDIVKALIKKTKIIDSRLSNTAV
jgi:hypothetical protein